MEPEYPHSADAEFVQEVLGPGGLLARRHPAYEPRPSQVLMSEAVGRAFAGSSHLMVEAPPGTGKTYAYLVPAVASGRTVVVSTGTRTLQDQLFQRDIPLLAEALGRPIEAALMKGRDNYLCLHRLEEAAEQRSLSGFGSEEDADRLEMVREWAGTTEIGDRAELDGLPEPWRMWEKINASADTCLGQKCHLFDPCFLTRMRRRAQEARLIVVNHHLLLSDLVLKASAYGAVIPPYALLIVDEAHMLEEVATSHLGRTLSSHQVSDLLADTTTLAELPDAVGPEEARALGLLCGDVRRAAGEFFKQCNEREGRFLLAACREDAAWTAAGSDLGGELRSLAAAFEGLAFPSDRTEALRRRAEELGSTLRFLLTGDEDGQVLWGERRGRGTYLSASPIEVGSLLQRLLFDTVESAVLTSSTLTVDESFDFVRSRIGPDSVTTLALPSPFDLQSQSVLYVPKAFPEPASPGFTDALVDETIELLSITDGRAFVLFTSFASMRRAREALEGRVDYPLLMQGEASRHALLSRFRATPRAVLLATASFWQGVDVPGNALSLVVIEKLPFDVPSDPVVAARCEAVRKRQGNPFAEYQIPSAAIDLKQGLGRLLRTRADRGVLAVLDARLRTRRYGKIFLRSLPPYPIVDDLEAARAFYAGRPAEAAS